MATNLGLDDTLVNQAKKLGHHRSKKEAVTAALREYIAHYNQKKIKSLFGAIDFDPDFDYKKARQR